MSSKVLSFLLVFLLSFLSWPVEAASPCENSMNAASIVKKASRVSVADQTERHELSVLLETGEGSFVDRHPWVIMSAPQRIFHMITIIPPREVADSRSGFGMRNRYPFFSDGTDITDNKFIIGQLEGIENLVAHIEEAADGKAGGFQVPTLLGPPGTGKSWLLELLRVGLRNVTTSSPTHFAYTFEWVDLNKFPELKGSLPPDVTNEENPLAFPDPINDSPFALLPEGLQMEVLSQHGSRVVEAIGRSPQPKRRLNPKSQMIWDVIVAQAQKEKGEAGLTEQEIFEAISRHVRIKRLILGDQVTSPIIPNPGPEPDLARLFGGTDPLVRFKRGTRDPFSVQEGVIALANQGAIFWDELFKYEMGLLGSLLNYYSSNEVQVQPGQSVPVDILNIAASNTADIPRIRERDPNSPLLDRSNQITWNYLTLPEEVGREILIGMNDVRIRDLGAVQNTSEEEPQLEYKPIGGHDLLRLFPERQPNKPIQTPHGRFAVTIDGDEETGVFVSPHALEFMSYVILLTRLNFDPAKVESGNNYPMVTARDAIFADPEVRLRVLLGLTDVTSAQLENLAIISQHSGEGSFGMGHRDVQRWWSAAVAEARKSNRHRTVTPMLLFEVLKTKLRKKSILSDSDSESRDRTILFSQIVFSQFVAPAMSEDLNLAFARSEGRDAMDTIYDEMMQEIRALSESSDATHYHLPNTNEKRSINRERFKKVAELYQKKTGRQLSLPEIATWQLFYGRHQSSDGQVTEQRNPGLLRAIAAYQTDVVMKKESMNIQRLLDVASNHELNPKPNERQRASELVAVLRDELGYNQFAAREALQLLASMADYQQQSDRE